MEVLCHAEDVAAEEGFEPGAGDFGVGGDNISRKFCPLRKFCLLVFGIDCSVDLSR